MSNAAAAHVSSAALSQDRVEWHLWNWNNWMQYSTSPGKHCNHASGGIRGYTNFDVEAEYEEGDRVAARAVQAVLDDMPQRLRIAVYVAHGVMAAVFRLRNSDTAYDEACCILAVQLAKRGMC